MPRIAPRPTPETPADGQESVWDYPRPPRVEAVTSRVQIDFGGRRIVDTDDVVRVLETSHPPTYYVPRAAFGDALRPTDGASFCEFKGAARYFDIVVGDAVAPRVAWTYPHPMPGFETLEDRIAVYAGPMDEVRVAGEVVVPQPGGLYGGWITSWVVGPFKGGAGTMGW